MSSPSSSTWTLFARIVAVLCTGLFVLSALAALVLFNVERRAFNPATYNRALVSEDFYAQFPLLLGNLLSTNLGQNAPAFVEGMTAEQWSTLVKGLLPEPELRAMTEDTINQVFAYLNGETQNPQISTLPLKRSLNSPAGVEAVLNIIQSLPSCTLEQVTKLLTSPGQGLCNPPPEVLDLVRPLIRTQLQITAAAIPDQIPLITVGDTTQANPGFQALRGIRLLMRLSPLLPLGLLLLITVLVVRTLRSWLGWWGWPFLLTGLPGMLIGFAGAPLFTFTVESIITRRLQASTPLAIIEMLRRIINASVHEMLKPVVWESLALIVLGAGMIAFSYYLTRRDRQRIDSSEAPTRIF